VHWGKFLNDVESLFSKLNAKYYMKNDLRVFYTGTEDNLLSLESITGATLRYIFKGRHNVYRRILITGIIYLCSLGVLGFGYVHDFWTLNDQIMVINGADYQYPIGSERRTV